MVRVVVFLRGRFTYSSFFVCLWFGVGLVRFGNAAMCLVREVESDQCDLINGTYIEVLFFDS